MAAPLEPDRLAQIGAYAVLVPREIPRNRDGELACRAGKRDDARLRRAETLDDATDGAPVRARVEDVGRLEQRDFLIGETAEDRLLLRERLLVGGASDTEPRPSPRPRRRRSRLMVGDVGEPSFTQPASSAASWQSGQTSTSSAPSSGENRTARSPRSSVRSHTAHARMVETFVTRIAQNCSPPCAELLGSR